MIEQIDSIFQQQQLFKIELRNSDPQQRIKKLRKLRSAIESNEDLIYDALAKDLRKSRNEAAISEVLFIYGEIDFAIRHLQKWMRPKRVGRSVTNLLAKSSIVFQPKGLVLIISPWNYPFQLTMSPLVSAIAAGNCIVLKPSEHSPYTAAVIQKMISESFDVKEIVCIEGEKSTAETLLKLPFDHIFFTGSSIVGKLIMKSASDHLSSVTLELGGKSPVILDETAHLEKAANKVAWGKLINAGQTCIAPDYVLIPEKRRDEFVRYYLNAVKKMFFTIDGKIDPTVYAKIINQKHADRLLTLIRNSVQGGARLVEGGVLSEDLTLSPTLLLDVSLDNAIMGEEIFGPILPVITYGKLEEAIAIVNRSEKPLALYVFSENKHSIQQVVQQVASGGVCINDVLIHVSNPHLPFGGVNGSGQGSCHGFFGFKAFSHERAVMRQSRYALSTLIYPPYTGKKIVFKLLKKWI
ncbi:aldehyde dehydrogenase family protein [Sphingobacterium sp. ML3W]|uniref:aldehyde dehydrogenase family protein n=1 Tax=Sphingobacterium sp. ML3W TaxID=1538644 RepID=UPI00249BCEB1|nr:aldehyde dehydrogenase family protein [Sphingobacterium sp. ML3W]WFA79856.1 aldehyde dehydrogenase family protein [Sphingobacterium sp. ML3W]